MKNRALGILLAALCAASLMSGCAFLPFEEKSFTAKEEGTQKVVDAEAKVTKKDADEDAADKDTDKTNDKNPDEVVDKSADKSSEESADNASGESNDKQTDQDADTSEKSEILKKADLKASQYNYDVAIELLKSEPDYDTNEELQEAVKKYEEIKATCVSYPLEEIPHVFFHTLIYDTDKAFDGDYREDGYNQMMTTVSEFKAIIQSMYDKGYVMVSPHNMAKVNEDGTMKRGRIMLPPGKTPFVLSQDDVSYYHYMDGDGFASKLALDKNGEVKCQYIEEDGSISVGDYDMVPIIDSFVKEHPDFSYKGRKGILAMTGYNGVLGYRTDIAYKTGENLQDDQKEFLASHPHFNYEKEVANATKVANVMKRNGWEFASHTWGHKNATESSLEELQTDNEKWEAYVEPILGDTDMIIFAFGADIGDWQEYSMDNPKFAYYKSRGYNYYCNVDSNKYWVQITGQSFRQGRRNLDGYRLYYNPEMVEDLFNAEEVFDSARPVPVPEM